MSSTSEKAHWERIYETKDPTEVSWYQPEPERSLALIDQIGFGRRAPILDVVGGAQAWIGAGLPVNPT
jgi:hypothetical protein